MFEYQRQIKYLDLIIRNNKFPHAFLFYGRGDEFKLRLAKSCVFRINNPGSSWEDFESDGDLADKIKKESHPDLFIARRMEDKKEISVSQVRDLRNFVSRTPMELNFKSAIINEAEFLNEEGWNAILKTLEEPAGNTVIFILSSGATGIPKTVLSRVVSIPFYGSGLSEKRQFNSKNDIIVNMLLDISGATVVEKFDLAEKISSSEDIPAVLDEWLLSLRSITLENPSRDVSDKIEKIVGAKYIIVSTNANRRLVLENLFLNI